MKSTICEYRTEGSDSPPYRMVPMCTCGWNGTVIDGQGQASQVKAKHQWIIHSTKSNSERVKK